MLLAAAGLTPQVVTETIYALAVIVKPAWIPSEIRLVTTDEGWERARLALLSRETGWFHRLRKEYKLPPIKFGAEAVTVIQDGRGGRLKDLTTDADHHLAADAITELVRSLTEDQDSELHVSLAGGRKTMGFFLGSALSFYGREQDRLSHVLVGAAYESHPDFYYPTRQSRLIYTAPPESRPLDTSEAEVRLAEIPFVRLRDELPPTLLRRTTTFGAAVAAVQSGFSAIKLTISLMRGLVRTGGVEVQMARAERAFYAMLARARKRGEAGLVCPSEGAGESVHAKRFLAEYGRDGGADRTVRALAAGMEKGFFLERRSRVNRALREALGSGAGRYMITADGRRPETRYGLDLEPNQIEFEDEGEN